jgi:7-carboxy-7-deazaguanine synthase
MNDRFEKLNLNKIQPIVEVCVCIQGEGQNAGIPHFLVRTSGCNLNCQYSNSICDTAYASWNPEKGSKTYQDIIDIIKLNPQINHAFVTGGEPTIYKELLVDILTIFKNYNIVTAIESNGSIFIPGLEDLLDLVTISPKLKNSVPKLGTFAKSKWIDKIVTQIEIDKHEKNRSNYDQMKLWTDYHDVQFKFVVSSKSDLDEIKQIQKILDLPQHLIYLMPEGDLNDKLQEKRKMVIEICIKEGYNYSDRLHILTYGEKRGV